MRSLIVLFCAFLPLPGLAEGFIFPDSDGQTVFLSRYSRQAVSLPQGQTDLLGVVAHYRFGPKTQTVGQALERVLADTGYRLAPGESSDPNLPILLDAPLPGVQRDIGPARVDTILRTLAGPSWRLVSDPLHRLISFDLEEKYWPCGYRPEPGVPCE